MLMRNSEYQIQDEVENRRRLDGPFVIHSPQEMLLGQIVLMLLLAVAILLREMV